MKQSAILQSGDDHHPQQPRKICDKNALMLRPPSDEQQQHLRVGRRDCVSCLFNHPSYSSLTNLSLYSTKDHHAFLNPGAAAKVTPIIHFQRQYIYTLAHETFGPHHKLVAKEINLTPQSAILPYYNKGQENSCVLSLGSTGKGKEAIVASPNNFLVQLSGGGGLGVTDNDNINNNVPRKNKRKRSRPYSHPKMSVYSFPTNVKNLLSTGIFEGIPVKYVSWSRGNSLKGIIKGTNYLCSCERCKMNKAVNAYEFEKHAGCDTKHPNNHIYFPSGKSLYSVVQELKAIVENDLLFEAIRTASGTPINIKNFQAWKALYESPSNSFGANPMNY
ncbi:PREDICTED: uncharacterized protein LOC109187050 [Ipomoea nil]|uniref:uncharacterized protein LOC109187050 n=1 Tax=Ipomoea nil TaxID=35883 RepID=UPI00090159D5|nr:PREDICTED: uncharacterized protein LOC109187050 [Ipomoea nil]